MLEKQFQSLFNRYASNVLKMTCACELKVSHGTSIPFSAVVPHQVHALMVAKHGVLVHKIPDLGCQNPFDCFVLAGVPAFVVIMFECDLRAHKEFIMIDVDAWASEMETSDRKSLTLQRGREIGTVCWLGTK